MEITENRMGLIIIALRVLRSLSLAGRVDDDVHLTVGEVAELSRLIDDMSARLSMMRDLKELQ